MSRVDQFYDEDTRWPPERRVSVIIFPWFYRIHSWAVYGMAGLDPRGYDELFPVDLTASELGSAAWIALHASRYLEDEDAVQEVRAYLRDEAWKRVVDDMKRKAGVRSAKALFRDAGNVDLIWTEGTIGLEPHRSLGSDRWALFEKREKVQLPETVSSDELGAALLAELEISRNGSYEGT